MKFPHFISIAIAASMLHGGTTTARAESALAVVPFSSNYSIQEVAVLNQGTLEYTPDIVGFDETATFAANAAAYGDSFYTRGFPIQSTSLVELPASFQKGQNKRIAARNSSGQIAGESNSRIFIWEPGNLQFFPFLSGQASLSKATATDINDRGQIVGYSLMENHGQYQQATLWQNGQAFELETSPGFKASHARSISNDGKIVGDIEKTSGQTPKSKAVSWRNGQAELLEGEGASGATHINQRGQIAGWWEDPSSKNAHYSHRAVIWQNGKKHDLGEIVEFKGRVFSGPIMPVAPGSKMVEAQGGYNMEPTGFSNRGQMVGNMQIFDGCVGSSGSFYFDGQLHNLQTLMPKDEGWEILTVDDINDRSQIIGLAMHEGHRCVFLLSPAPANTK